MREPDIAPRPGSPGRGRRANIRARRIDVIVVYKVDRLTRSLADFAKLVAHDCAPAVRFKAALPAFSVRRRTASLVLGIAAIWKTIAESLALRGVNSLARHLSRLNTNLVE
jgi:Resolvase, N terminal domain